MKNLKKVCAIILASLFLAVVASGCKAMDDTSSGTQSMTSQGQNMVSGLVSEGKDVVSNIVSEGKDVISDVQSRTEGMVSGATSMME